MDGFRISFRPKLDELVHQSILTLKLLPSPERKTNEFLPASTFVRVTGYGVRVKDLFEDLARGLEGGKERVHTEN